MQVRFTISAMWATRPTGTSWWSSSRGEKCRVACRFTKEPWRTGEKGAPERGRTFACRTQSGGNLPRPEPLLCGVGERRIQTHKRSFWIAELSRAVAPRHHLRLMNHFQLIFQPRELSLHVIDLEFDDSGAACGGLSASLFE